jgi:undecaprenyl diphosphate synthase
MDGNGRWAERQNLPRSEGHRRGAENIPGVVEAFAQHRVKYLTLFAFSAENWDRPEAEVEEILSLLKEVVGRKEELAEFHEKGVRLLHLGERERLPPDIREKVREAMDLTSTNERITLSIAFDYGGRQEIIRAVRRILEQKIPPSDITPQLFSSFLYTQDMPDPDLIIRTGGELRLSNFLLWQGAYSELYFTPTLWPDFGPAEIKEALFTYQGRERRFGKL